MKLKEGYKFDGNNTTNLTNKAMGGFFWVISGRGAESAIKLVVTIVLARLLEPRDFGIVAAALIIFSFSDIFANIGIGPAIVQRNNLTERHIRTAYTLSILLGIIMFLVVFNISDLVASFFKIEELSVTVKIMSLIFIINSFSIVSDALIERNLLFKLFAKINFLSYLISFGLIGILLAIFDYGIWALVSAYLSQALFKTLLALRFMPHKKKVSFHYKSIRDLVYFGGGHTLAHVANSVALQGDKLVVGRFLGAELLGLYERSYQFMTMPISTLGMALDKTLFPIMSKAQDDIKRLGEAYQKVISLISLIVLPISIFMFIMSNEIVLIILGPNWIGVIPVFQILAIGILFRTSYKVSSSLSRAMGAVYIRAIYQIIYAGIVIIGSLIGYKWGILGVASAVLLALFVNFLLMAQLCLKLTKVSWKNFATAHFNAILYSLFLGVTIKVVLEMLKFYTSFPITLLMVTGIVFILLNLIVFKFKFKLFIGIHGIWISEKISMELLNILSRYIKKNKS